MPPETGSSCPGDDRLDACARGQDVEPTLRTHLEQCPRCREAMAEIQQNNAFLGQMIPAVRDRQSMPVVGLASEEPVPGYQILREVSRGGQGVVYQAIQLATKRTVALKLPLSGNLATARQRQRFEREIEIIAGLRHPHIVTLYGTETLPEGRTVLVMEYVEGRPLDQRIAQGGLCFSQESRAGHFQAGAPEPRSAIREALGVFVKICEAVNYAHQHGVIHRDLKPANILIDADGQPRILDFGLAKAIDADTLSARVTATMPGEFMGTLAYAAPESVKGDPKRIDTRTDVYALGVMLYEALAGQLPYLMTGSLADGVRSIVETEPAKPSTHNLWLDDELDTIALKALAKDQDRRYQSARELAQDLARYLAGDAIQAKSESAWYVLRKTARRHKMPLAAAAGFVVLLAAFAISMSIQAGRIAEQRNDLAQSLAESNLERGRTIGMTGSLPAAEDLLWREFLSAPSPPSGGGARGGKPAAQLTTSPAYWALWELYSRQPCVAAMPAADPGMTASLPIRFSSDGNRLLSCVAGDNVNVWTIPSGRLSATLHGPPMPCRGICAAPAGETLALWDGDEGITLWGVNSGQSRPLSTEPLGSVGNLAFSGHGEIVAVGGQNGTIQLHQVSSGRLIATWPAHDGVISVLCFSPDDRTLASHGQDDRTICLWDVASGKARGEWKSKSRLFSLCFSPDGRILAYIDSDNDEIALWEIEAGQERERLTSPEGQIHSLAYSPDGRAIAAGGFNGVLRIFDLALHRWVAAYAGHAGDIGSIRFSPESLLLATSALDGRVRLWELPPHGSSEEIRGPRDSVLSLCFSPSGRFLAAACGIEGVVQLWNVASGQSERILEKIEAPSSAVAFHPSGNVLASGSQDGMVRLWDLPSGALLASFRADEKLASLAFSPDGKLLASSGEDRSIKLWNVAAGARQLLRLEGHTDRVPCVTWSPDGKTLASAGRDGTVILWDWSTSVRRMTLGGHHGPVRCAQFSPDGRLLATSSDDQTIRFWDVATGRCLKTLTGHTGQAWAVCFSPDGRLLVSGDHGGNMRLWDAASGRFLATLDAPGPVYSLSFSPDGLTLAAGCDRPKPLMLWDLTYYDRHIAGNLEYQLERVGIDSLGAERVARLRAWAAEVHARPLVAERVNDLTGGQP